MPIDPDPPLAHHGGAMAPRLVPTCVLLSLLVLGTSAGTAPAKPAKPAKTPAPKAAATNDFVAAAVRRNLAGLELSQLALQRSTTPAIRRLAQQLVSDSAASYEALLGIVSEVGPTRTPETMDLEQRGVKSRLSGLSSPAFDQEYLRALKTNDERDIALYRSYAAHGDDPSLKSWASDRLPAIRKRRQLAEAAALEIR
jgi:putative membrane protein